MQRRARRLLVRRHNGIAEKATVLHQRGGWGAVRRMMQPNTELEIKLIGAPSAVMGLQRSVLIRGLAASDAVPEAFYAVYYDTPDNDLEIEGVSLRLRRENGTRIQSMKAMEIGGALVARTELERRLEEGEAFPVAMGDEFYDQFIAEVASDLAPALDIKTDRASIVLQRGDAKIEAAFDFCVAKKPGSTQQTAFAEVELELLSGPPSALFQLARLCCEEASGGLSLGAISKFDRARSALGLLDICSASNRVDVDREGSVAQALAAGIEFCARRIVELAPFVRDERRPTGIHQMRVALRRFRSIERVFRPVVQSSELRDLSSEAKHFAQLLGRARDWDVFIAETLAIIDESGARPSGFHKIVARAEVLRADAWHSVVSALCDDRFNEFTFSLQNAAFSRHWTLSDDALREGGIRDFAGKALEKRYLEAKKKAADLNERTPAAGHPLRIALKKLRYAAQLFRDLYPRELRKPYMTALSTLQDSFGVMNDALVAQTLAGEAAETSGVKALGASGFIAGYRGAHAHEAALEIAGQWRQFESMAPFWRKD